MDEREVIERYRDFYERRERMFIITFFIDVRPHLSFSQLI